MACFTLFVVLPTEEVCTLRKVTSGIKVNDIKSRLELSAGLPSQIYKLISHGEILQDDYVLELGHNVWDGFLLRAGLEESWRLLFEAVAKGDLDKLFREGHIHIDQTDVLNYEDSEDRKAIEERGHVALYLASWMGSARICQNLLSVGVNPNGATPHQRTPLFAAVVRDNDYIMEIIVSHRAKLSVKDCNGDTPLDIAKRNFARQCISRIQSFQRIITDQLIVQNATFSQAASNVSLNIDAANNIFFPRSSPFTAKEPSNTEKDFKLRAITDFSSKKRSLAFDAEQRRKTHRDKHIPLPPDLDQLYPHGHMRLPRKVTSNTLGLSDTSISEHVHMQKLLDGMKFKVALSIPNSSMNKYSNKIQDIVTWNDQLSNSDFLHVKSALREEKQDLQPGHLNMTLNKANETQGNAFTECPDHETLAQNQNGEAQTSVARRSSDKDNDNADVDARIVQSAPTLDKGYSKSQRADNSVADINDVRPKTVDNSVLRSMKSKRKRAEALKTAVRQVQLAEHQKRLSLAKDKRETFEKWLRKKQKQKSQDDSDESSSESDDKHNSLSFQTWLKEVRNRPKHRHNSVSAGSLGQRKTRPIQGLVEIEKLNFGQTVTADNSQSHMRAYKEWLEKHKKFKAKQKTLNANEAKRLLVEDRQEMLATAITFDEWMTHVDKRKQLMKIIHQADSEKLHETERGKFTTRMGVVSFDKRRDNLAKCQALNSPSRCMHEK